MLARVATKKWLRSLVPFVLLLGTAYACESGDGPAGDASPNLPDAGPDGLPPLDMPGDDAEETDMFPGSTFVNIGAYAEVVVDNEKFNFKGYTNAVWSSQDSIPQTAQIGGCSLLVGGDGTVIASASFHRYFNRAQHNSFSFADNGTTTVVWGLFDIAAGAEWSSNGPAPQITVLQGDEFWYVDFFYQGEATENFSSTKASATSTVTCMYAEL